jgi:flagellar biosynthesis/type III secretory pathway protein FliH
MMSLSNRIELSIGIDDIVPANMPRGGAHGTSRGSDDAAYRARCEELETENARLVEEVDAVRTELAAFRKQGDTALSRCVAEIEQQAGEQVVELAVRCTDVLLRDALPHTDMIRNIVRDVVPTALSLSSIRIHLSPADASILRNDEEMSGSSYEILSDPSLGVADVMVRTANGTFDARVDERLKLLREELNERRMSLYAERDAA